MHHKNPMIVNVMDGSKSHYSSMCTVNKKLFQAPSPRINQIKQEEGMEREANHEKSTHLNICLSNTWEDLALEDEGKGKNKMGKTNFSPSILSDNNNIATESIDLNSDIFGSNSYNYYNCDSDSSDCVVKSPFRNYPYNYGNGNNTKPYLQNSFRAISSPNAKSCIRRSVSPVVVLRPSTLNIKRKYESDTDSCSSSPPSKKFLTPHYLTSPLSLEVKSFINQPQQTCKGVFNYESFNRDINWDKDNVSDNNDAIDFDNRVGTSNVSPSTWITSEKESASPENNVIIKNNNLIDRYANHDLNNLNFSEINRQQNNKNLSKFQCGAPLGMLPSNNHTSNTYRFYQHQSHRNPFLKRLFTGSMNNIDYSENKAFLSHSLRAKSLISPLSFLTRLNKQENQLINIISDSYNNNKLIPSKEINSANSSQSTDASLSSSPFEKNHSRNDSVSKNFKNRCRKNNYHKNEFLSDTIKKIHNRLVDSNSSSDKTEEIVNVECRLEGDKDMFINYENNISYKEEDRLKTSSFDQNEDKLYLSMETENYTDEYVVEIQSMESDDNKKQESEIKSYNNEILINSKSHFDSNISPDSISTILQPTSLHPPLNSIII
ncbi:putative uncharacterized protein DDB_G0282133 isoform X2 [Gordionus sp. m RMFG-2023]